MSKKKKKSGRSSYIPKNKNKGKGSLSSDIRKFVSRKGKKGIASKRIFSHFLKSHSHEQIIASIKQLESSNQIKIDKRNHIHIADNTDHHSRQQKDTLTGKVDMTASGSAYIIVDAYDHDVYIPKRHISGAMHNDTVRIALTSSKRKNRPEGKIVEIIKRNQSEFIGIIEKHEQYGFCVIDDHRVHFDIFIPKERLKKAEDRDTVLVKVVEWSDKGKNPIGKVLEVFSNISDNDREMKTILLENGFNLHFPQPVLEETKRISTTISSTEYKKRIDYRSECTFTIDPDDAKDFDDALSIKKLDDQRYEVGVHIADVSHYVRPDTELDEEAILRGTSVYLPDRVCPMLPEKLSNEVCSLRPDEEKYAFSVFFQFDEALNIVEYTFAKTVIRSDKRFTYNDVQHILDQGEGPFLEELLYLNKVAKKLRENRFKNGSINFETEEVRFRLNEQAVPVEVYVKERKEAHLLIEDFMLLANTTVAKYLSRVNKKAKHQGVVYRIHDNPDTAKLEQLSRVARRFGYKLAFENPEQTKEVLNNLISILDGKPEMHVLSSLMVRCMAKAVYTTDNIGHYGLGFEHYTHFTSPIRRYPDVLVHRLLEEELNSQKTRYQKPILEDLCKQSSMMERRAQEAEREAIKYKQVEYMQSKVGVEFEGIISGVIAKGFFVEIIENKCEGFVSLDGFGQNFIYDDEQLKLTGTHSDIAFQIGEYVYISVLSTDLSRKRIELDYIAHK